MTETNQRAGDAADPPRALACRETSRGIELDVRVKPGAGRSCMLGVYGERLKLAVAAPPERGKANRALRRLVAELLGCRLEDVEVMRGEASRDKTIAVYGVTLSEIERLVEKIL